MTSIKIVDDFFVSPPPNSVPTTAIPLTFLDIHWLSFSTVQRLFFYKFNFTETTLSTLKTTLSLALHHFFPLAGKIVSPSPPQLPYISYTDGDAVHLRATESTADFNHLTGNHGRNIEELEELAMKLPPNSTMAIQVTVFPNSGVSIGVTYNHMVADGRAISHFMKSWASIYRAQDDPNSLFGSNPIHNRDLITDPGEIASVFMNHSWFSKDPVSFTREKLQITAVVSRSQIDILKNWINKWSKEENPENTFRISTFIVATGYIWACLVKLRERGNSDDSTDDKDCHFIFTADCRGHLKLPGEYFGNCLEPRFVLAKRSELIGENGVLVAAKAIGREVSELGKGAMREAEGWLSKSKEIVSSGGFFVSVTGSPKLGVYETDFGWGRPKKVEVAHIGSGGVISMAESGDEEGGIEFGVVLEMDEVVRFNALFQQGILMLD